MLEYKAMDGWMDVIVEFTAVIPGLRNKNVQLMEMADWPELQCMV